MAEKVLMKGNEAIAEAAIRAGCRYYFGYPITPQTEVSEYMARRMPEVNGYFVQAESEVAAINMVHGAASAGGRAMTSSSSPGIALKQETISYMAGAEVPAVIVNMARGGPGCGSIQGAQGDYFQSTRGGGNGDYNLIVLAPNSVQELADLTVLAFDLADRYRNPVMLLGDGIIGQMMEAVELPPEKTELPDKPWAANGNRTEVKRPRNLIHSVYMVPTELEKHNVRLQQKYAGMTAQEIRWEEIATQDADVVLVAYGISSRICETTVEIGREAGLKVGLLRPITLWPFPYQQISNLAATAKAFLAVEMSAGQMVQDLRLAVNGAAEVRHFGRMGSVVHTSEEILDKVREIMKKGGEKHG